MKKDLEDLISRAKNSIDTLLNKYGNSKDPEYVKRAKLLAYWLKDYCRFIVKEETFIPSKLKKYKRGDIIQVHLGYRLGREEGGLHYAVVISNDTSSASDILTIIPLTSKKPNYKPNVHNIDLGNTIYTQLNNKYEALQDANNIASQKISEELQVLLNKRDKIFLESKDSNDSNEEVESAPPNLVAYFDEIHEKNNKLIELRNESLTIKKILTEISHMKTGSIALVGQITTISKLRIYNPINKNESLHGIKLSPEDMDKLDNKIKQLFTH